MKFFKVVLASVFLTKAVNCSASLLSNDRHGAVESVFAARTLNDAMYDDILNSKSDADIRKYFRELGNEAVTIHAPSILLKAISKGNKTAVDTLISLGADPFKVHKVYNMTAWDFLSVIPEAELSTEQRAIKADWRQRYMNQAGMERAHKGYTAMKDLVIENAPRFADLDTYKRVVAAFAFLDNVYNINFANGSCPLHQAIIGNNFKLFTSFMAIPELPVNTVWTKKGGDIDIKRIMNIDPVGWTALMLAVEFDRVEMVRRLLERPGINVSIKAGSVDAFTLARRLPEEKKRIMLPLLKGKLRNATVPTGYASFGNLKDAIEKGASSDCLTFYLNRDAMTLDTLKAAVTNVTDEALFSEIVAEAETIFKTDRGIHKQLWTALKADVKSGTVEKYKAKIAKLVSYGFKFEERLVHVDATGGMTPVEEACTSDGVKHELALAVILSSSSINRIEAVGVPIVLAVKNDRPDIVKYLLRNATALGLNYDLDCNAFRENLMHFAITWIKDEGALIEIIDTLLALKPELLNAQSATLDQNIITYNLNEANVKYTMVRRIQWTPLMYAVMMRKNRVAKHLASKGADRTIKGLDGVDVNEIIAKRCEAYTIASRFGVTSAQCRADDDTVDVTVSVDPRKKEFVDKAKARIVEAIKNELSIKYVY